MLENVIGMILVDAYGEDEQLAAFRTAFEEVVEVPIKATVSLVDVCFPRHAATGLDLSELVIR